MGITNRYIDDIRKSLEVYAQLFEMQTEDKIRVFNYIGQFYNNDNIEQNIECYKKIMANIHLFRWLEIERYTASSDIAKSLQSNNLWSVQTMELAKLAIKKLDGLGIKPEQNGYGLNSELLLSYVSMQEIQTQNDDKQLNQVDNFDSLDGIEFIDYDLLNAVENAEFDSLDLESLGISTPNRTPETTPETAQEQLKLEAEHIKAEAEAESNRVEIPIDANTDKNIEIQFGKIIEQQYVKALMPTFDELYSSCFSGVTQPDGILTPRGVLKYEQLSGDTKKQWHFNHQQNGLCADTQVYKNYMNMVLYAIGVLNGATPCQAVSSDEEKLAQKKRAIMLGKKELGQAMGFQEDTGISGRFPQAQHIAKGGNVYYPYMHHAFMTGYFALCSGLKSEQKEQGYHANTVKVTQYNDLSKWIRKQIKTCLLKAITDFGLGEDAETYEVDAVCKKMINAIKNVVFIQDKQKQHITIKICQNTRKYTVSQLEDTLNEYLTQASGTQVGLRAVVKSLKSDVATVDLIIDQEKYTQNNLMACQVIDSIIESGQVPSWNNAVIGRDDNGIVNYDFTQQNRCAVAIYGQSGQGKGLITQALVQNALIDNCNIFYFDGKPDNGTALGKIAWDRDKEAAVFNGLTGGQNTYPGTIESFQHGIRSENELYAVEKMIPDFEAQPIAPLRIEWPFSQTTSQGQNLRKQLIDVSRTLMAFQFVSDMVDIRANSRDRDGNIKQAEDFCVFIIDEIQAAQAAEKNVRQQMADYMASVEMTEITKRVKKETKNGVSYEEKRDGKVKDIKNWNKDPGYMFCKKWINWANNVAKVQWNELVTKQLRNSRCTIITIFQTNDWFTMDDKGIGRYGQPTASRIGYMMKELQPKVTKLVGKNSLKATGQNSWGDMPLEKYIWKDEIQQGKWALAVDESGLSNEAQVLRPFKIFTTDLGNGVRCQTDDRFSGGDKCRKSRYDTYDEKTGEEKKDPAGLDSYTQYMFNNLRNELMQHRTVGLTPEEVLQKGYDYFNDCLTQLKSVEQIKDYFYNLPSMVEQIKQGDESDTLHDDQDEFSLNEHSIEFDGAAQFSLADSQDEEDFLAGLNAITDEEPEQDQEPTPEPDQEPTYQAYIEPDHSDELQFDDLEEDGELEEILSFDLDEDTQDFYGELNKEPAYQEPAYQEPDCISQRVESQPRNLADILNDDRLQAEEKVEKMRQFVEMQSSRLSSADCLPVDGSCLSESHQITRDGFVQFQSTGMNKPKILGKDTIVPEEYDIKSLSSIRTESSNSLQERYDTLLSVICQNINKSTVVKLMLTETTVQVNGKNLFLGRLLTNELTIADIVNIDKTFKTFGNLKTLIVDTQVIGQIQGEYSTSNPVETMFLKSPSLQAITILSVGSEPIEITRESAKNLSNKAIELLNYKDSIDKLDAVSAQFISDTVYKVKAVQLKKRVTKTAQRMQGKSFGDKNSSFKNGRVHREAIQQRKIDSSQSVKVHARKTVGQTINNMNQIMKGFSRKNRTK